MIVSSVTNTTKFDVNYAPTLSNTSEIARQQGYVFTNGILGNGTFEHQFQLHQQLPEMKDIVPYLKLIM